MAKFSIGEEVGIRGINDSLRHNRPTCNGIIKSNAINYDAYEARRLGIPPGIHYEVDVIGYRKPVGPKLYWEVPEADIIKLIRESSEASEGTEVTKEKELSHVS